MSRQALEDALKKVPFLAALGVAVEEAKPGDVILRLPSTAQNQDFQGALAGGAVYSLGGLAAAVAFLTHPNLVDVEPLQKGASIKFLRTSSKDVTARATVTPEIVEAIRRALESGGDGATELPVEVLDGHGADVAEIKPLFAFRWR